MFNTLICIDEILEKGLPTMWMIDLVDSFTHNMVKTLICINVILEKGLPVEQMVDLVWLHLSCFLLLITNDFYTNSYTSVSSLSIFKSFGNTVWCVLFLNCQVLNISFCTCCHASKNKGFSWFYLLLDLNQWLTAYYSRGGGALRKRKRYHYSKWSSS